MRLFRANEDHRRQARHHRQAPVLFAPGKKLCLSDGCVSPFWVGGAGPPDGERRSRPGAVPAEAESRPT